MQRLAEDSVQLRSLSTSGDRSPRLQAKRRMGEVASCDDTAVAVTRCVLNARLVWPPKHRFVVVSGTMTSETVSRPRTTVDFKSTPLEPLALQARVVQFEPSLTADQNKPEPCDNRRC